jgi:predicted amidophosphoribosyltransferase
MRTSFKYANVLEYLPTRYSASPSQKMDRTTVYDFKDGYCEARIFDRFVSVISAVAGNSKSDFLICFIPASTSAKTIRRYGNLAVRLENATGVKACLSAIRRTSDTEAGHLNGKVGNPIEGLSFDSDYFRGKNVILIDDVITRGRTFCMTANELLERGADDVVGLFVAKTINPDWHSACA